ncbi:hypothetical protein DFP98_1011, partial [Cohnella phaseoli]
RPGTGTGRGRGGVEEGPPRGGVFRLSLPGGAPGGGGGGGEVREAARVKKAVIKVKLD